jgi:hypothetical protein
MGGRETALPFLPARMIPRPCGHRMMNIINAEVFSMFQRILDRIKSFLKTFQEVLYGMTIYDWVMELEREKNEQNRLFSIMVFGDLIGIPILPPYYTLRLIPYLIPTLEGWKRSMLRERDFTDIINQEIG